MSVTVYGASDDCVELEGDIYDEFYYEGQVGFIGLSDGTLLSIEYNSQGLWHVDVLKLGPGSSLTRRGISGEDGTDADGMPAYSDIITIIGEIDWAVYGSHRGKKNEDIS